MKKWLIFLWLAFWLYLCLIPALEVGTASYAEWRAISFSPTPNCLSPEACPQGSVRLIRGLVLWILTSPFLAWALSRYPRVWTKPYRFAFWNNEKSFTSLLSLALIAAVLYSTVIAMLHAPYESARITQAVAILPMLILGFLYRGALLSAKE